MLTVLHQNQRETFRKRYNIPEDAFVVLGSGFIHPRKGVDIFIDTAMQLLAINRQQRKVYFFWLGGELRPDSPDMYIRFLARDIINSGNTEFIRFIGETVDVTPFYSMSDLFFMSSREDPFPTVVMEAFAAGLPVLGIEGSSGSVDLIRQTGNFVMPYAERGSIASKILELSKNRDNLKTAGQRGKELILQDYRFEDYVIKIVELVTGKLEIDIDV
jgi:glycosyltransferase involved in cell wall biosynthesis